MKEIKKLLVMIMLISICISINCITIQAGEKLLKVDEITNKHVEPFKYEMAFIVKFSNIIYEKQEKKIKIPIFQGSNGDVLYKDFREYCVKNGLLEPRVRESGFMIKCKKGEIEKTFHEFLAFYKSNILKNVDIDKPAVMSLSATDWTIKYNFSIEDVPCEIVIHLDPTNSDVNKQPSPEYKSVYEIIPEENVKEAGFIYKIHVGFRSK